MFHRIVPHVIALAGWLVVSVCVTAGDWRKDLLIEAGVGTGADEIRAALEERQSPDQHFRHAYENLASEQFQVRERAHAEFLNGGQAARDWLAQQPTPVDPEVMVRRHKIMRDLTTSNAAVRENLLFHAMRSLLDDETRAPGGGGVFHEWFGTPAEDCARGYRSMRFIGPEDPHLSEVKDGRLRLFGDRPGQVDQRLVLDAAVWPGAERFPDHVTVRTVLGGKEGGAGVWHLGVSIGRVKVLFHPGFRGGAFRLEDVHTHANFTQNTNMGFTPGANEMLDMTLVLDRVSDTEFSLTTTIVNEDGERFENTARLPQSRFGEIDTIGLERSGRSGGDAMFDHFTVTIDGR